MSEKMILQNVRCSYVFVQEPRKNSDGTPGKYGVQVLIPKNDPQAKKFQRLVKKVLADEVGEQAAKKTSRYKLPLRDGDEERDEEEYEGMYFFNANKKKKPGISNRNNEPADEDDLEEYCYSGAYFHVSVNIYYFPSQDGSKAGIAVGLNNVMLRKKGERLDGSTTASQDFAEFAEDFDEEEEDDFDDDLD